MIKASHIIIAIIVFLMVLPGRVWGIDIKETRETLRGIKSIVVYVEDVRPEIERGGWDRVQIKSDVELKLRFAGVRVSDKHALGGAYIFVTPNIIKHRTQTKYIYHIALRLNQSVNLARNWESAVASTWSIGILGGANNLDMIRRAIKDQVDIFLNAYLSVNPK